MLGRYALLVPPGVLLNHQIDRLQNFDLLTGRVRSQQIIPPPHRCIQVKANFLTTARFILGRVQENFHRFERWRRCFVVVHKPFHHPIVLKAESFYPGGDIHLSIHTGITKVLAKPAPHRFQRLLVLLQTFGQSQVNFLEPAPCLQSLGEEWNGRLDFTIGEQLHPLAANHLRVIRGQLLSPTHAPFRIAIAA